MLLPLGEAKALAPQIRKAIKIAFSFMNGYQVGDALTVKFLKIQLYQATDTITRGKVLSRLMRQ